MSVKKYHSPFDKLRRKYDRSELRCGACGYVDSDGGWRVTATGKRITYQFVCPACDAVETRSVRLES